MTRPPLNPIAVGLGLGVVVCILLWLNGCYDRPHKDPLPANPTEVVVSADKATLDELMAENAKLRAEVDKLKAEHPDAKITGGGTLTSGRIRVDLSKVRGQNPPSSGSSDPPSNTTTPFPPAPEPTPKCAPGQIVSLDGECLQRVGEPSSPCPPGKIVLWDGDTVLCQDYPSQGYQNDSDGTANNAIPVDFEVQATILGWEVGTERRVTGTASLAYYDSNNVRHYLGDAPWRADGSKLWVEPKRETRWLLGPMVGVGSDGVVAGASLVGPPRRLKRLEFRPFVTGLINQNDGLVAAGMLLGVQR